VPYAPAQILFMSHAYRQVTCTPIFGLLARPWYYRLTDRSRAFVTERRRLKRWENRMSEWIVLLEAVKNPYSGDIDKHILSRLFREIEHARPVGLHTDDRYAVQLHVPAAGPLEAVSSALADWSAALGNMGIAPWELIRAEVMTEGELAEEIARAGNADDVVAGADEKLGAEFDAVVSGLSDQPGDTATCAVGCDLRWGLLLQGSHERLTVLSADGSVVFVLAPDEKSAMNADVATRTTFADHVHPEDAEVVGDVMAALLTSPGKAASFFARLGADGEWRWCESVARNLLHEPLVRAIVVNSRDITYSRQLEERLAQLAVRDELTGLLNRVTFLDQLELAMARSSGTSRIAVFFIDIIDFRGFVERYGTSAGDQLLVAAAERLKTGLDAGAAAARLGGDEFALVCEDVSNAAEAADIAKQITSILGAPVSFGNAAVSASVSIGVALGTSGMLQPATLLRHAEVAMYRARRGQMHFDIYKARRQSRSNSELPPS
jgi:diguanylate cyclase (GGDEF)-like protein